MTLLLLIYSLVFVCANVQANICRRILNDDTIQMDLDSALEQISGKLCSFKEDRMCECNSLQLHQDAVNPTLTIDFQCNCSFSKPVTCSVCSSLVPTPSPSCSVLNITSTSTTMYSEMYASSTTLPLVSVSETSQTERATLPTNMIEKPACRTGSDIAWGTVTALLVAIVIITVTGWTCTCVIMKRAQVCRSSREHTNNRNLNLTYSSYCQENSHYTSHLNVLAPQDPQYDVIPPMCLRSRVTEEDSAQYIDHGQEVVIVSSQDCQENAHCGSGQEEVTVLSHDCQENLHYASSVNNLTPQAPEYDVIPALATRARTACTEEDGAQGSDHGQSHDCA